MSAPETIGHPSHASENPRRSRLLWSHLENVRSFRMNHKNVLKQSVRIVIVVTGKTDSNGQPDVLILATDCLDLAAELVALAYKYRWSVELFFRWLKCILGCRHLLATNQNGVEIQVYLGIIAS